MADVITRFKLETTQYDSKLRDASKGLAEYTRQATQAGNEFGKFTQKNVEAARALGSITPSANNAKDKVKEFVGAFNDAAKAYNALTKEQQQSDFGKAMADSLGQLSQQLKEAKKELYDMGDAVKNAGSGGLFAGLGDKMSGALQVFAGNMLTKAAGAVAGLGSEMYGMVQQGIELARQGEGIRIAFERLGRGDILDGLRKATHGTVTDLELMKAAVKFNDFKLPLDELGTMLAFAQQKAKDTGQSVDYMVDSIVTGLGRKSLMILDNLGLSATEVKERMAETGDMTKAVGDIIRDQMSKAGDYVETAADRAAQAHVSLQNKMEELGRKFAPVEEASSQLWTSMKIGILDIIGGPLATLLNQLTEAGRLKNMLNDMNGEPGSGNTKVDQQVKKLNVIKKAGGSDYIFNSTLNGMLEDYNRQIAALDAKIKDTKKLSPDQQASKFVRDEVQKMSEQMKALGMMRDQLAAGAKQLLQPVTTSTPVTTISTDKPTANKGGKGGNTIVEEKDDFVEINGLINMAAERVSDLQRRIREAPTENMITELRDQLKDAQAELDRLNGKEVKIQMETGTSIQNDAGIQAYIASIKQQLETADYGTSLYNGLPAQLADMTALQNLVGVSLKAGLGTAMFDAADATGKDFWTRAMEGGVEDTDWQAIVDKINEKLKDMNLKPISIDFKTGEVNEMTKDWKNTASAIHSVGQAMSQIEDPAAKVMGTIAQAIATMALSYAEASKQAAMNPANAGWGWIAFAAAGMATMMSTISAIHSATGYANGGVVKAANGAAIPGTFTVPGTTYSNDQIPAMLNAGETVLTRAQAGNIASQLQGAGGSINLNGVLSGENIYLAADRYARRSGRGELVTFHR